MYLFQHSKHKVQLKNNKNIIITLTVQNKYSVTVAYIDFSRAFDSVSHEKLLVRLYSYGVRGNVLQWIRQFFHGRSHQTRVGEALSVESSLLSGGVQASGIGPVLYLIYINDLAQLLERYGIQTKFCADDVKAYFEISAVDDPIKVQTALDLISV